MSSIKYTGDLLKDTEASSKRLGAAANFVHSLAKAHITLGNGPAASQMFELSELLAAESDAIRTIAHHRVDADFKLAQQSSANVLQACLAGAKLTG